MRSCFCSLVNFSLISPNSWMPIRNKTVSTSGFLPNRSTSLASRFHQRCCRSSFMYIRQIYEGTRNKAQGTRDKHKKDIAKSVSDYRSLMSCTLCLEPYPSLSFQYNGCPICQDFGNASHNLVGIITHINNGVSAPVSSMLQ